MDRFCWTYFNLNGSVQFRLFTINRIIMAKIWFIFSLVQSSCPFFHFSLYILAHLHICMKLNSEYNIILIFISIKLLMYLILTFWNLISFIQFNQTNWNLIHFKQFSSYSVGHFNSIGSIRFQRYRKVWLAYFISYSTKRSLEHPYFRT